MIATFVRNTCFPRWCTLGRRLCAGAALAMMIISYNNDCKGRRKADGPREWTEGDDADEEDVFGVVAGSKSDAGVWAGADRQPEDFALGTGFPSAAEGTGGLGGRSRKGVRRYHQIPGVSSPAARQGLRPLRHGARRYRRCH